MTIQQAIEKAAEAREYVGFSFQDTEAEILLQPLFWQSLGKAMGWDWVTMLGTRRERFIEMYAHKKRGENEWLKTQRQEEWLYHWHRFIDHLIEGKTAESFFERL